MDERIWYVALAVRNRFSRQRGQTLTEYAVLLAFIVILVVIAVGSFGGALSAFWQSNIVDKFPSP